MKKRILAIVIVALSLISVLAFSSCGKAEQTINCPADGCEGVLKETELGVFCDKDITHAFDICVSEDCGKPITVGSKFCPSCGTSQADCKTCASGEVDSVYCPECGNQVLQSGKMKFGFDVKALGDSAMILCKGMLGIFIVTGIIITFILVLNTIVEKINQSKKK